MKHLKDAHIEDPN